MLRAMSLEAYFALTVVTWLDSCEIYWWIGELENVRRQLGAQSCWANDYEPKRDTATFPIDGGGR